MGPTLTDLEHWLCPVCGMENWVGLCKCSRCAYGRPDTTVKLSKEPEFERIPLVFEEKLGTSEALKVLDDIISTNCIETWDDDDTKKRKLALKKSRYALFVLGSGPIYRKKEVNSGDE